MKNKFNLLFLRSIIASQLIFLLCICLPACVLHDDQSVSTANIEFFQEKQNVFFELRSNPNMANKSIDYLVINTTWFKAYPDNKRAIYIQESINLFNNKQGE